MYRSYYRSGRRRKKKKIIISDLELLNYSLDDLKKIISKTNKKLKCGKCERELAIESLSLSLDPFEKLHNTIKSGPHGIYYKCMQCGMNISIQTKIDFNEDPKLNELEDEIKDFRINGSLTLGCALNLISGRCCCQWSLAASKERIAKMSRRIRSLRRRVPI